MKKILSLICTGVLLIALCVFFVACESKDSGSRDSEQPEDPELPEKPNGEYEDGSVLQPIAASEDVVAFFEKYLSATSYNVPRSELLGDTNDSQSICIIINSEEEFEDIAPASAELPSIDFNRHTLIIGQVPAGVDNYIEEHNITIESGKIKLTLMLECHHWEPIPSMLVSVYYWGIYPKLPENPVEIYVLTEDGNIIWIPGV